MKLFSFAFFHFEYFFWKSAHTCFERIWFAESVMCRQFFDLSKSPLGGSILPMTKNVFLGKLFVPRRIYWHFLWFFHNLEKMNKLSFAEIRKRWFTEGQLGHFLPRLGCHENLPKLRCAEIEKSVISEFQYPLPFRALMSWKWGPFWGLLRTASGFQRSNLHALNWSNVMEMSTFPSASANGI